MTIEEILALLQSTLDNPNATPEEILAVLGQVQEALTAMAQPVEPDATAGDTPDTQSAPTPAATPDQIVKAAGIVKNLKSRADAGLKARADLAAAMADVKAHTTPTNRLPFGTKSTPKIEVKSRHKTKHYKSNEEAYAVGKWFKSLLGDAEATKWCNDHGMAFKTLTEGNTASAGILVPEQMEDAIWNLKEPRGVVRNEFNSKSMSSPVYKYRKLVSGNSAYFVAEGGTPTETNAVYAWLTLSAKKLMAESTLTYELADDAYVSVVDQITEELAYSFTDKEDSCGFVGDGTSTYGGILGLRYAYQKLVEDGGGTWTTDADKSKLASMILATGSTWSSITRSDITKLKGKIRQGQNQPAKWYCNSVFYYDVMEPLALAAGGVSTTEVVNGIPQPRFDGYPVVFVEVMPSATAVSDIPLYFGSASGAADFGDLKSTTVETDKNIRTQTWDVVASERFDINVHDVGNYDSTATNRKRGSLAALITKNS